MANEMKLRIVTDEDHYEFPLTTGSWETAAPAKLHQFIGENDISSGCSPNGCETLISAMVFLGEQWICSLHYNGKLDFTPPSPRWE